MAEKTRYSDEELQEFKELILEKLEKAKRDYEVLKARSPVATGMTLPIRLPLLKYWKREHLFFPKRKLVGSLKGRQNSLLT